MKLRFLLLSGIFFLFTQTIFAQANYIKSLKFDLAAEKTQWKYSDKIIVRLSVKNTSDTKIKVQLSPNFYLIKEGIDEKDRFAAGRNTYWATTRIDTPKGDGKTFVISDEDKLMFYPKITLEPDESKTVEMDLARLAWGMSISAYFPSANWYSAIPKGNYKLYFTRSTGEEETIKYEEYTVIKDVTVESNKVSVVLLDGKKETNVPFNLNR